MTEISTSARRRGRIAAASRDQVLALAMSRYLHGRRVDVQAIASELGIGRTTIYRWFGSRDELIGEVLVRAAEPLPGRQWRSAFLRYRAGTERGRGRRQRAATDRGPDHGSDHAGGPRGKL